MTRVVQRVVRVCLGLFVRVSLGLSVRPGLSSVL